MAGDNQIKRFVDIEIRKDTPRTASVSFDVLLVITNNPLLSLLRRHKRFTTADSVGLFFGYDSEEYKAADSYFMQDPFLTDQPKEIHFGKFANLPTSAILECGEEPTADIALWQAITNGGFKITINDIENSVTGLDFRNVQNLSDVASVITSSLGTDTCQYLINRFMFFSNTQGAGVAISALSAPDTGTDDISQMLDGVTLTGLLISNGVDFESFKDAISAIEYANNGWYCMAVLKSFRDTDVLKEMAVEIEARRKIFIVVSNDTNIKVLGNQTSFAFYLKEKNFKRTGILYHHSDVYPEIKWLGMQLPKPIGSTNWAYKTFAGETEGALHTVEATPLTEAEKDAIEDVNCNFYTSLLGADFTYPATMGGGKNIKKEGEFIDIVRNMDFLQARIEEKFLSLFLEKDIIPYTDAGITIIENRLQNTLQTFGIDTGIIVKDTINISFPKRNEVSQDDRDARLLPDGTFTSELQGAIDSVIIRGTVYI